MRPPLFRRTAYCSPHHYREPGIVDSTRRRQPGLSLDINDIAAKAATKTAAASECCVARALAPGYATPAPYH